MESPSRTVLITGASSGIGYELAKLFARDGYDLVLVARSRTTLEAVAKELYQIHAKNVKPIAIDLSESGSVDMLITDLQERKIHIDILVNNAGFGVYGFFTATSAQAERAMIELNMGAVTHLSKALLPGMLTRGEGKILNVASTAAFQPGPLMAVYYATKAYVLSFSEALSNELRGTGVNVCVLCPGPTRSGFMKRAAMERSRLFCFGVMNAAVVARIGYQGLMAGKTVIIPGFKNGLLAFGVRFMPRKLVPYLVRMMQGTRAQPSPAT